MAFWRFGFAQESGIDALLKHWDGSSSSSSSSSDVGPGFAVAVAANGRPQQEGAAANDDGQGGLSASSSGSGIYLASPPAGSTSAADPPSGAVRPSLEQLLEEEDLLQECKAGHAKLVSWRRLTCSLLLSN